VQSKYAPLNSIFKGKEQHSQVYKKGLIENINSLYEDLNELLKLPLWLFGFCIRYKF